MTTTSIFKDVEHLTISGGTFTFTHSPLHDDHGQHLVSNNSAPVQNYDYRQHGTRQEPASNDDVSLSTPKELFNATIRNEYAASYERDPQPERQDYQSQSPLGDGPCVDRSNRHPSPPRSRESQRTGSQCRQNDLVGKGRRPEVKSEDEEEREEIWREPVKAQASTERHSVEMSRNKRSQTIPVGKPRRVKFEDASEEEEESRREPVNERGDQVTMMERRSTEVDRDKRSQTVPAVNLGKAKLENNSEEEEEGSVRKPVKERKKQASTAEGRPTEMGRDRRYNAGYEESRHEPVKDGKRQATKEVRRKNKRSQTVPVGKPESEEEGESGEEEPVEQLETRQTTAKKKKAKNPTANYLPSQPGNMGSPNLPWPYAPGFPGFPGFPPTPWQGSPHGPNPPAGHWNLRCSKVTYSNNGNDHSTNIQSGNISYSSQSNVGNDYSQNTSTVIKKRRH